MKKRLILFTLFLLSFFFLSQLVYTNSNLCLNEPDKYILKCTFKEDLFNRDILCLDLNCTESKLYTYKDNIFILQNGNKSDILYKNSINLNIIGNNTNILKQICSEEFSNSFLSYLKRVSNSNKKTYFSENLRIEPFTNENLKRAKNKLQELDCYDDKVEVIDNWIIQSRDLKEYCKITKDENNNCFITKLNFKEKIIFQMNNSSNKFYKYLFSILLGIGLLLGIFGFLIHIFENKKVNEFFKITQTKIITTIIIAIPLIYLIGVIINIYYIEIYFNFNFLKELFTIFGILFSYIISCITNYLIINLKK